MDIDINLLGIDGHTEISVTDEHIRLKWTEAGMRERKSLRTLIDQAAERGLIAYQVDEDGKAVKRTSNLPGLLKGKAGELILKASKEKLADVISDLVKQEVKGGHIVVEAQKDGTWKIIQELTDSVNGEKRVVTSTKPVAGG